jgi:PAS domain S-box-containing protein
MGAQKTILVTEDDGILAANLEETLMGLGYNVLPPVATGEAAVACAKARKPDLIVMDIELLGQMNGIEAVEEIRSFSDVPVVYLTGYAQEPLLTRAKMTAPHGYLVKPVRERELAATLGTALCRRDLDERLKESEERYRIAIESANDGVLIFQNGGHVLVNQRYLDMFGYDSLKDLFSQPAEGVVHPDDRDRILGYIRNGRKGEPTPSRCEFRGMRKDGQIIDIEASVSIVSHNGAPAGLSYLRDVTEQKRAEEALRESEERYRQVFAVGNDALFLVEKETDTILEVNESACLLYGYSHDEFVQMKATDVSAEPQNTESRLGEHGKRLVNRFHRKKDGTVFPVDISVGFFALKGRQVVLAAVRDMTDLKRAAEVRERLEVQIQQIRKEESLGRMAAAIAHHYNNLMNVVLGNLEMALWKIPEGSETQVIVTEAMKASERAATISQLMLAYLGQSPAKRGPSDLSGVCREILPSLAPPAQEDLRLTHYLRPFGPTIHGNKDEITQVLSHLLTNAREALGDKGGDVSVFVGEVQAEDIKAPRFFPTAWTPGLRSYGCLSVSDGGSGIGPDILDNIFDPFFSTKFTGRGLGLAVVLGIVRSLGGAITVESVPGEGTTFRVFLPVMTKELL